MRNIWHIAWAAGFFEGEGCITRSNGGAVLRITGTDPEPLVCFGKAVGAGTVYGSYDSTIADGYRRKPFWVWVALSDEAVQVLNFLLPWLSERRIDQARNKLGIRFIEGRPMSGWKLRRMRPISRFDSEIDVVSEVTLRRLEL